ncbi:MFS transporter [Agromyces flavus]|uniref:Nitrate/nitrite transporter NarK n=1 Tax=Agromyces flavus TaxID=589382 RepID=A0A1H2A715_9MICO|nr:MFS transporter [Agromyces flavus]SDT41246.1 Nitrate/nitrite transporter NarK [Agromyces flavus]
MGRRVAAYIVSITNRSSLSAVGVDAAVRFDADASTLSMFAVIQLAVYGGMQIPVGLLLDRFGARPIITIGMALMAIGQFTLAFAPDVAWAIAARMLLGAGDAAVFPSVLRVVAVWFPERQAPLLVQLTGLIGQSGQILAVLPLAALLHATSWSVAFGSLAGLGALFTILTFAVIRNRPPGRTADVSVDTTTGAIHAVRSSADLRQGFRESWAHPGTRLAFWSHFTTPFSGTAFVLLWGFPFLTVGEGLTTAMASLLFTVYVVFGILVGPVIGALSTRHPYRRSRLLVLPVIGIQVAAWLVVIAWPGPAPLWLLFVLAFAMSTGGPGSMIGFDHARTFNPSHRLSTATASRTSADSSRRSSPSSSSASRWTRRAPARPRRTRSTRSASRSSPRSAVADRHPLHRGRAQAHARRHGARRAARSPPGRAPTPRGVMTRVVPRLR